MSEWVSVHVFHHGSHDDLITDGIAPAVARASTVHEVRGWFFLRYWDGGPHVRVRVRTNTPHAVRQLLHEDIRCHLAAHPSVSTMDPAVYAATAAELARRESLDSYEPVPRAVDSVADVPYRPEYEVFGRGESLAAVERHFMTSSRIALDVIGSGVSPQRRRGCALSMSLITLAEIEPDLDKLGAAFAEMRTSVAGGQWAGDPEAGYRNNREQLESQVTRLWERAGHETGGDDDPLSRWAQAVRLLRTELAGVPAHDTDTLRHTGTTAAMGWGTGFVAAELRATAAVLMRCGHLVNNRMGIPLPDEMYLTYLAARTIAGLTRSSLESR
jgi:hypothetical protein